MTYNAHINFIKINYTTNRGVYMEREEIIERIAKARIKANLSARALSYKIGMNDGYINRLENKKDFLPSLEVLVKIIETCGMTEAEFFYPKMEDYKTDTEIIRLLSLEKDESKKQAIITLLK